ncbi:hypothetical protein EJ02DRAFT_149897 [Clathrospora elynae]|uniref:C2H2-type domain-containing protein n=1 Tax=Clathrospora elynae TaxID=706981 RepID=A0A6A5SSR9_9PLEO|nr:hypothetical protein EJ02DRAFT_149897 [Clathrospora elynae]
MVRPPYKATPPAYHCAMCEQSFATHSELNLHTVNHVDRGNTPLCCAACTWPFDDSHALELHKIQSGHGTLQFVCEHCEQGFVTQRGLDDHVKSPQECPKAFVESEMAIFCDRACRRTYDSQQIFNEHRSDLASECADFKYQKTSPKELPLPSRTDYQDLDKPSQAVKGILRHDGSSVMSDTPSDTGDGVKYCRDCKKRFKSMGQFNNHILGCVPTKAHSAAARSSKVPQAFAPASGQRHTLAMNYTAPEGFRSLAEASRPMALQTVNMKTRQPVQQQQQLLNSAPTSVPPQARPSPSVDSAQTHPTNDPAATSSTFICNVNGCGMSFRFKPSLIFHRTDKHGIGGQPLDMTGGNSWMPSQRERLREQGLLRQPSASPRGRGGRDTLPSRLPPKSAAPPSAAPSTFGSRNLNIPTRPRHHMVPRAPAQQVPILPPDPVPTNMGTGGLAEMEQAKSIQGKTLRLLIQSDIFIHDDGKMTVCGIDWTRIPVYKQHEVATMLNSMCHLPPKMQGEYLPPPNAFMAEDAIHYPTADFCASPVRDPAKPGLSVIALACSKVGLEDGCQEVVKIAAIDLITGRILMSHLICTDSHMPVADWRSSVTGLFSWRDMELARQAGYKVFKGWSAARSALWKFVDKETIILGHNLRADLDSLRMVHGRGIDIAKVVEKAARGPLSKLELSLDSLSRDYPKIKLRNDPEYGRDCLLNAFAARQFGLWVLKNQEKLNRDARQRSVGYQGIMPNDAT